jgi:hypothetical protein
MTQPSDTPTTSGGSRSAIAAHPVISAVIAILIFASIFFSLYVPLYARATPMVGDFPFFYFYLLVYMPAVGIVLGIVLFLQHRLRAPADAERPGEVTR